MRRIGAALLLPLATALALAGCGSSAAPPASPNATVTATGGFGTTPTVKIPAEKASSDLYIKTEVHGTGPALAKSDSFLSNYVVYIWSGTTHKLALSTFTTTPQVLANTLLPGLHQGPGRPEDGQPGAGRAAAEVRLRRQPATRRSG